MKKSQRFYGIIVIFVLSTSAFNFAKDKADIVLFLQGIVFYFLISMILSIIWALWKVFFYHFNDFKEAMCFQKLFFFGFGLLMSALSFWVHFEGAFGDNRKFLAGASLAVALLLLREILEVWERCPHTSSNAL